MAELLWNAINRHDVVALRAMYDDDAVEVGPMQRLEGVDAIMADWDRVWNAFPDVQVVAGLRHLGDKDLRANEWIWRGTHTGQLEMPDGSSLPATGRKVEIHGAAIIELRNGKIVEKRDYFDVAGWAAQMGLSG
jgi:steroid delta-isomerase-like uncharacterized protein